MPRPRGGERLADEIDSLKTQGVDVLVSLLTRDEATELGFDDEKRICEERSIGFFYIRIEDRSLREDRHAFMKEMAGAADALRLGLGVAIHCREGIRRSATAAACLMSTLDIKSEDAFRLIAEARGCPVPNTREQRQWVEQLDCEIGNMS